MKRRILSIITALTLCLSLLPGTVRAADNTIDMQYNGFVFAQGVSIVIKENGAITSVYAEDGKTLLSGDTDVSTCAIYGGWLTYGEIAANASIVMESGTVTDIFGGNFCGTLGGNTNVEIRGGTAHYVYGGGNQDIVDAVEK